MTFAFPLGLLALLSVPAIVVLHLLRERQNLRVVSSILPWSFLTPEVRGAKPRRIPFTWLLFLDILIAVLLSLAWSQPRIRISTPIRYARHMIILIDVSTSMRATDVLPNRVSQAIIEITSLINGLGPRDVATIITFGKNVNLIADTRRDEFQQLIAQISTIQAGETGHNLEKAMALGIAILNKHLPAEIHIFSDAAFFKPELDNLEYPLTWHFTGTEVDNQAVLDLSTNVSSDGRTQVFTRLVNYGAKESRRIATLQFDGIPVDSTAVLIPPDSILPQTWIVRGQPSEISVTLLGGDFLQEDDSAAVGLQPIRQVRGELVTNENSLLSKALQSIPNVELEIVTPQDFSPMNLNDFVVFNREIPATLPREMILFVEPKPESQDQLLGDFLTGEREQIPPNSLVFVDPSISALEGMDFSGVRWVQAWQLKKIPEGFSVALKAGNTPLLITNADGSNRNEQSQVSILLADLTASNFSRHPSFPIFFAKLIEDLRRPPLPGKVYTGDVIQLEDPAEYTAMRVFIDDELKFEFLSNWADRWPPLIEQTKEPIVYRIELEDISGNILETHLGINAGEIEESDIRSRAWVEEIESGILSGSRDITEDISRSINLLTWLLGAAVLALFAEAKLAWH